MTKDKQFKDLEEILARSIEALRASPAEREKYPALDRLLSRIEARERQLPSRAAFVRMSEWVRPLLAPLSSAVAGFAGAALALVLLPHVWFANPAATSEPAMVTAASSVERGDDARILSRSIHRLERSIHGLEKFQPLVESRIESLEDALQRKYADAYASGEDMTRSHDPYTPVQMRPDRGAFF